MIIQTEYEIKKAHNQMGEKPLKKSEKMIDIIKWLRNKSNPFNYDVNIFNWDGYEIEIEVVTGEEFISIWDKGHNKI